MMGCIRALDSGVIDFDKFREMLVGADISQYEKFLDMIFTGKGRRKPFLTTED